jgi:hypothetical protein
MVLFSGLKISKCQCAVVDAGSLEGTEGVA